MGSFPTLVPPLAFNLARSDLTSDVTSRPFTETDFGIHAALVYLSFLIVLHF